LAHLEAASAIELPQLTRATFSGEPRY